MSLRDELQEAIDVGLSTDSEATYESGMALRILRTVRPDIDLKALKAAADGKPLTLDMVNRAVPNFPLHLKAEHVKYVHTTTVSDLFTRPLQTPIFKAFAATQAKWNWNLQENNYGLVTGWSEMEAMVLHNWYWNESSTESRKRTVQLRVHSSKGAPVTYTLEPLSSLLEAIVRSGACRL